mmetsp:Transcript_47628/g.154586  ORF Transcript_47628/g.154586 Transcript_47628/m.154586 type:complete len:177 (+) Transcript_47628:3-533(+)
MELHAAWASQMGRGERGRSPPEQAALRPLWRLRAHMAFWVDSLQYYLQVDVLDVGWQALAAAAEEEEDFEALAAAHEATLASLSSQCFLQAGPVSAALHSLFQLCLALCRLAELADTGLRQPAEWAAQVDAIAREFERQTSFLLAHLSSLASPQVSPHLSQLLLRLNFNGTFRVGG